MSSTIKINVEVEPISGSILNCTCKKSDHLKSEILLGFETFRRMRKTRNLSINKVAEITGLHRNTVGYIDRGEIDEAKLSTLTKIANALDCELRISLIPYESEEK
ncbi:MAG: helix-turn-helix transcriptional regulator [Smithella sp.]